MITLKDIKKAYGHTRVLNGISFKVKAGEFVSIIGPSGAGKSTLIDVLIGAAKIDSGEIAIDDFIVNELSPEQIQDYRRNIGIVFQDFKLLPKKTVFENTAFALEVCGYKDKFIKERTTSVLKICGLENQRNSFPHQLSGGEKQRTAIARALVHAPDLLIADEPTGNLDPDNALALAKLLQKINKEGTTILLATHNKEIVNALRRRVIEIEDGKVIGDKACAGYKKDLTD
ncbi:ATP-binding cassette domain-containing protein [Patescibacteria group bacterium]|nr:ATP-binding cassette domain-containing protein [Patescibacteria group bacterium]